MAQIPNITPSQIPAVLDYYWSVMANPFLWGDAGIGKSQVIEQWARAKAAELDLDFHKASEPFEMVNPSKTFGFIDLRLSTVDALDFRGAPALNRETKTTEFYKPAMLPDAAINGEVGILVLDELPDASGMTLASASQLILDRCVSNSYHLPDGWMICAAGNEGKGTSAKKIPSQLANRFGHLKVVPSVADLVKHFNDLGSDGRVGAFLRLCGEGDDGLLHNWISKDQPAFCSPRTWAKADQVLQNVDDPLMRENLIASFIGDGPARRFEGFLQMMSELTNWSSICADPHNARVPDRTDAIYAMLGMASNKITGETAEAACVYISRMPKEFQVLFALDVINDKRKVDVVNTRDFSSLRLGLGDLVV